MKKKISIITSGHPYYDERIFYKFARSLNKNGYEVSIICSTVESEMDSVKDNNRIIGFNGSNLKKFVKLNKFEECLRNIKPDVIICCEPLPIFAASKIRKENKFVKIIYDVTEWYPENVAFKLTGFKRYTTYILLFFLNIIASNLSDSIIIGEIGKKKRYELIAPLKRKKIISYYPVLEFFKYSLPILNNKMLVLCYAGLLKFDRGLNQILEIAERIAKKHNNLLVTLKLIGKFNSSEDENSFKDRIKTIEKVNVEIVGWCEYPNISNHFANVHLCFDLRERNFIYNNSLPIKIFEYMACGKPFIFTDIKPIRDEIDFTKCGFLVNPNDLEEIIMKIEKYFENKELLDQQSKNARSLVETKYNWEYESLKLLGLINSL
jgi:glycosyltransferase involved in cell wall biosynthesis